MSHNECPSRELRPLRGSGFLPPAHAQPPHTLPHRPFWVEAGAGAFRWGFSGPGFPQLLLELPEGHWPRHWTAARPPLPREPQRSRRGSRKLLGFPMSAAFARNRNPGPAPPARPRRTLGRGWGRRGWADPDPAARSAPPPPAEAGWRRRPRGSAHPRLPRDSFESSPSRWGAADCGVPQRGGRNATFP